MPDYRIVLDRDATIRITGVDLTYMKGRHTVNADTLADLRATGAGVTVKEVVPENAMMTAGGKKHGYNTAGAIDW